MQRKVYKNAENEVVTVDGGEEELIDRFKFPKNAAHGQSTKVNGNQNLN
jgi:hypothetical protein